ncbi:MAG: hypothetical protein WA966_01015 [Ornithinimicrobium sp.]
MIAGVRFAVGALGVGIGLWGAWLIFGSADSSDLLSIAIWLGGGIIANDGIIAVVSLVVAAVAMRLLPKPARAPAAVALVVVGTITVVAIPFLGRFGAREDNPTLLDRNYVAGYGVLVLIVVVAVTAFAFYRTRQTDRDGLEPGEGPARGAVSGRRRG